MARALLASFSPEQKARAVLQREIPWDLLTHSAGHNTRLPDRTLLPTGLPYPDMTGEQRTQLIALIRHYATRPSPEVAEIEWRKLERAGFDGISFAWIGTEERGKGHYYNIVAPTFMIEYDNVQHDANHLHTLWRDFTNDFGQDLLAQHYAEGHPA